MALGSTQAIQPLKSNNMFRLPEQKGWFRGIRSSQWFVIAVISVSYFMVLFMYGMIVPIMPSILVARAGVQPKDQAFWTSIMLLTDMATAVVACPFASHWIDRSHRRKIPFLAGVLLQAVAMALFTSARSLAMYIVERVLLGGSSALVSIAALALLRDGVGKERLGEALGYMELGSTVGVIAGPPIGGLVYQKGGYYAVCILGFLMILLDFVMRLAILEKRPPASSRERDPAEATEVKTPRAFTSLKLLKEPRMAITLWALAFDGMVIGAFDATIPSLVERLFGWDTFAAGLIFLVMIVPAFLEPVFGRLNDRFGARIMGVIGYILYVPCLVCLQFVTQNTIGHKVLLGFLLALCNLAPGMVQPGLYLESQIIVEEIEERTPGIFGERGAVAQAFGMQTMASYAGLAIGPIVGESLYDGYSWKVMAWTLGAIAGATIVPMFWLSNEAFSGEEKGEEELQTNGASEAVVETKALR